MFHQGFQKISETASISECKMEKLNPQVDNFFTLTSICYRFYSIIQTNGIHLYLPYNWYQKQSFQSWKCLFGFLWKFEPNDFFYYFRINLETAMALVIDDFTPCRGLHWNRYDKAKKEKVTLKHWALKLKWKYGAKSAMLLPLSLWHLSCP